jgi:hypothetical protein
VAAARARPERIVAIDREEVPVERPPTVAKASARAGSDPARAVRSPNTHPGTRVIGALNARTGRVFYRRARPLTGGFLVAFYPALG